MRNTVFRIKEGVKWPSTWKNCKHCDYKENKTICDFHFSQLLADIDIRDHDKNYQP